MDVAERIAAEKGSALTERERRSSTSAIAAARGWLESYAPDRARLAVQREAVPGRGRRARAGSARVPRRPGRRASTTPPASGDDWQTAIFATAADRELPPGRAFGALYLAFLGRPNGPRAGWLLASLPADFVVERLRAAAA